MKYEFTNEFLEWARTHLTDVSAIGLNILIDHIDESHARIAQLTAERDELKDVLTDIKTGQSVEKETCSWIQEDDPDDICYWETGCGNSFYFTEGTPSDNDMKYCC